MSHLQHLLFLKEEERTIKCNCGNQMDRDLNSAVNIMSKFLQEKNLLHQSSVNEESFLHKWKGFLRHTANGKEKSSPIGVQRTRRKPLALARGSSQFL